MREPVATTIHLKDYTPPAFLISTVELDVEIRDNDAFVRARLALTRNPDAPDQSAPLVLDGDELALQSIALDGRKLGAEEYSVDKTRVESEPFPRSNWMA